jgi:hypothetical protein
MKISDRQLVKAVQRYREHPHVQDRHGPQSLEEFGHFLAHIGMTDEPMHKGPLSYRVNRLIEQGYLATSDNGDWRQSSRLFMPGLYVTDKGKEFLENGHEVLEGTREEDV